MVLCATLCQDRWRGPSKCIHGSLEIADIAGAGKGFVSCSLFYPWRTTWPAYSCAIPTTTWFKNQEAVCFVHYSNLNVCSVENEVHFGFVPDHLGIYDILKFILQVLNLEDELLHPLDTNSENQNGERVRGG